MTKHETNEWKVVFVASPTVVAPYSKYEVFIDSKTGKVTKARKIEEQKGREDGEGREG